jgi:hypothetical protein
MNCRILEIKFFVCGFEFRARWRVLDNQSFELDEQENSNQIVLKIRLCKNVR